MHTNYYAVIFTSTLNQNVNGYNEMAQKMETLAKQQPGFLGISSARSDIGITVSYWETKQAILNWKANLDHQQAQKLGKSIWYASYRVEIACVERNYEFTSKWLLIPFSYLKSHLNLWTSVLPDSRYFVRKNYSI